MVAVRIVLVHFVSILASFVIVPKAYEKKNTSISLHDESYLVLSPLITSPISDNRLIEVGLSAFANRLHCTFSYPPLCRLVPVVLCDFSFTPGYCFPDLSTLLSTSESELSFSQLFYSYYCSLTERHDNPTDGLMHD